MYKLLFIFIIFINIVYGANADNNATPDYVSLGLLEEDYNFLMSLSGALFGAIFFFTMGSIFQYMGRK